MSLIPTQRTSVIGWASISQHLSYVSRQFPQIKRLLDKPVAASLQYLGCLPLDAVSAGEQDLHVRVQALERSKSLPPLISGITMSRITRSISFLWASNRVRACFALDWTRKQPGSRSPPASFGPHQGSSPHRVPKRTVPSPLSILPLSFSISIRTHGKTWQPTTLP